MKMLLKLVKMVAVGTAITVVANKVKEVVEVEKFADETAAEVEAYITKVSELPKEKISEIIEYVRVAIVWFVGYGITLFVTGVINKAVVL